MKTLLLRSASTPACTTQPLPVLWQTVSVALPAHSDFWSPAVSEMLLPRSGPGFQREQPWQADPSQIPNIVLGSSQFKRVSCTLSSGRQTCREISGHLPTTGHAHCSAVHAQEMSHDHAKIIHKYGHEVIDGAISSLFRQETTAVCTAGGQGSASDAGEA